MFIYFNERGGATKVMTLFESNHYSQCFEGFFSEWIENTSVQISRIQNQEIILYSWVVESGQIFLAYQTYGNCLSLSCKKNMYNILTRKLSFCKLIICTKILTGIKIKSNFQHRLLARKFLKGDFLVILKHCDLPGILLVFYSVCIVVISAIIVWLFSLAA